MQKFHDDAKVGEEIFSIILFILIIVILIFSFFFISLYEQNIEISRIAFKSIWKINRNIPLI